MHAPLTDKVIAGAMVVAFVVFLATLVSDALPSWTDAAVVPFLAVSTLVVVLRAAQRRRPTAAATIESD